MVSNFDTRLRPLLAAMQLDSLFDAIVISAVFPHSQALRTFITAIGLPGRASEYAQQEASEGSRELDCQVKCAQEVGAEKPNPVIFENACEALGVQPEEVVHVGDDRRYFEICLPLKSGAGCLCCLACWRYRLR